jgi:hypothetical protein
MKPDERDDAAAIMVLVVVFIIIIGVLGAGVAAFVSYADRAGGM